MAPAPLLVVAALLLLSPGNHAKNLHPVVLVPGYGSNKIDARLTAAYEPSAPSCGAGADQGWFQLWPNHTGMHDASQVPCFADQMSLVYDAVADDYHNADGVATRVPSFGSARGLIGWDPLVRRLEGMGYREGESLFGAPYDFRYAVAPRGHPSTVGDRYFRDLGRLIRRASRLNQGRSAVVVAHSYGCALTYQFLLARPLPWRWRFVKHVILLAPALGGFAEGMHGLIAGIGYGLPNVTRPTMTRLARSQQSTLWRLPTPMVFRDRPLVVTKNATYSACNMAEFLEAIGFPEGVRPYVTRVLPMWEALPAPIVPVTGVIGVGVRTPEKFVFGTEGFEGEPEVVYSDGDGDINMVSLVAIEEWSGVEGQVLKVVRLPGVHHGGFFSDDFALKSIVAEIYEAGGSIELDWKW
ncbi:lecithin-cholesterol acyltransferase-like 1 [Phragmites australis]|uniref:lecithin-cholesterol acyltransferase-like 1 n=1 Tax=Phragmites australis TaxID=29695 RepID=UPI002D77848B|nr:lecithin-cholesterol acyltransferase-like 1 [Phragmites australis]